ncbi:MAG TPA: hypothetical protein VM802_24085 [Chitinophaga sp.]|uniref:hypothetical protein n=1 Tax=Chitinophaga sp. TaxID=1869181 RepID=UPI002D1919FD|nr:hypothetical protein [Chitinophaga sp.]HVI47969.1 hypothetical protein [Chitinophaga sp.]
MGNISDPSSLKNTLATTSELHVCSLFVKQFNADTVTIQYKGLPGNRPKDYLNYVAIWEASVIPWNAEPIKKTPVPQNSEEGDFVIFDLSITSAGYILGYGVGEAVTDICTSAGIAPAMYDIRIPHAVSLSLAAVGSNSITINYATLPGYLPAVYKNWIGLWEGFASPYNAVEPIGMVNISNNASQGTTGINNITIGNNTAYTLVYFMGPSYDGNWPRIITNAGALLYFQTGTNR